MDQAPANASNAARDTSAAQLRDPSPLQRHQHPILWSAKDAKNYPIALWLTFRQPRDRNTGGDLRLPCSPQSFFLAPEQHARFDKAKGFYKLPEHTPRGIPDIIAVRNGRAIFLEVKSETGKLSEDQVESRRRAIEAGAQYGVVRSIDDVQAPGLSAG